MSGSLDFFEKGWRLSVGIVLFNKQKDIFMGERIDNRGSWQMPQGGVKLGKNECFDRKYAVNYHAYFCSMGSS